jgi:hypothetical protein
LRSQELDQFVDIVLRELRLLEHALERVGELVAFEFRQHAFDLLGQLVWTPAMDVLFDAVEICLGTDDHQISRIREPTAVELEREQ